ncbi:hypothetical protein AB0L53_24045 [Nonomuraea sp. NPDC052129]|uniref:hypothetical protein n=1 Tax=Nonomuraea sp. NPDC052129 TaxID=3154651 RepID=UPI0034189546
MIHVEVGQGTLSVWHAPWTRLFVRRARTRVPLEAIQDVQLVTDPLAAARGTHSGLLVTGFAKVGTWRELGGVKRLVCARRDLPGLRITLGRRIEGVDELILSVPAAEQLRQRILGVPA